MKRSMLLAASLLPLLTVTPVQALSGSSFSPSNIISDAVFFDGNAMDSAAVQAFLNSKLPVCDTNGDQPYAGTTRRAYSQARGINPPFTCLKDYRWNTPARAAETGLCGELVAHNNISSADVIAMVGRACGISQRVLLVLLQKEQSLVTDDWPWPVQYRSATGYGCPDTAACDSEYYGFFNQVYMAARQFKRYARNPSSFNYRAGQTSYILYNPNASCGGSYVTIANQATAGLYNYTPYQPNASALNNLYGTGDSCGAYGNRNFWRLFNDWFPGATSNNCYGGYTGGVTTSVQFRKLRGTDYADFGILSGTSTGCIESHLWQGNQQSWMQHVSSIQPSVQSPDLQLLYGDLDGSGNEYPVLFGLSNTSTGKIESHVFDQSLKGYLAHASSNRAVVNTSDMTIRFGDLDKRGRDDTILVSYRNTGSGMIELHVWNPGMQSWKYNVATNRTAVDPADNSVEFADLDGDGRDEAILVSFRNTGSGRIEFHVWNQGLWSWRSHIASNHATIDPSNSKVTFADVNGDGRDEAVLVALSNTGSGRIEFHVWNQGMQSWRSHSASNQPTL